MVNEASKEVAFGLDLTLYEGSDSPFDGLAHLDRSTAKTEIARPARAIKEVRNPGSQAILCFVRSPSIRSVLSVFKKGYRSPFFPSVIAPSFAFLSLSLDSPISRSINIGSMVGGLTFASIVNG